VSDISFARKGAIAALTTALPSKARWASSPAMVASSCWRSVDIGCEHINSARPTFNALNAHSPEAVSTSGNTVELPNVSGISRRRDSLRASNDLLP